MGKLDPLLLQRLKKRCHVVGLRTFLSQNHLRSFFLRPWLWIKSFPSCPARPSGNLFLKAKNPNLLILHTHSCCSQSPSLHVSLFYSPSSEKTGTGQSMHCSPLLSYKTVVLLAHCDSLSGVLLTEMPTSEVFPPLWLWWLYILPEEQMWCGTAQGNTQSTHENIES